MHSDHFFPIEDEIKIIRSLDAQQIGVVQFDGASIPARLERKERAFLLAIDEILDFELDGADFLFTTNNIGLVINASVVAHRNSVDPIERTASRYSECKVDSFDSAGFEGEEPAFLRAYYPSKDGRVIYDVLGCKSRAVFAFRGADYFIYVEEDYVVVESAEKIVYEDFSETCYSIMVALGFVSGKFIQNETYVFQSRDRADDFRPNFRYRKLRASSSSMYHALTNNPYGYEHMIGRDYAEKLYEEKTLTPINEKCFSRLVELVHNSSQIRYALVLFNEANSDALSLLVKNNCFYVVLELLRKVFHESFRHELPPDYSNAKNIDKYCLVFERLIQIGEDERNTLKMRNTFLHGDIKDIEGEEMVTIMQKQITLIYRLVLAAVGFDGFVIDHYAIRNGPPAKAFVKVN